jgi:hypothetical protein
MYDKHWTDDELFERLYELRPDDAHLSTCVECAERLQAIRTRYEGMRLVQADVSAEFLADQRRAIHSRIYAKRRAFSKVLVPVVATLMFVAVVMVRKPAPVQVPSQQQISDSELFEDVYNRISDPLPSSAEPIRSLFEVVK